jgi:SNF2 family DNA or RNA helicase
LFSEEGRKGLLFSEWTTMLDLIEPLLKKRRLPFVRLDAFSPAKAAPVAGPRISK